MDYNMFSKEERNDMFPEWTMNDSDMELECSTPECVKEFEARLNIKFG